MSFPVRHCISAAGSGSSVASRGELIKPMCVHGPLFQRVTLHKRSWKKLWFLHDDRKHSKNTNRTSPFLFHPKKKKHIHVRDTQRTRNLRLLRSDVHSWSRARSFLSVCPSVCVSHFLTQGGNNDHNLSLHVSLDRTHTHTLLLREVRQRQAVM